MSATRAIALAKSLRQSSDPQSREAAEVIIDLLAARRGYDKFAITDENVIDLGSMILKDLPEGPWLYRPGEHDDWGEVRDLDGKMIARASLRAGTEDLSKHRESKTDPAEPVARFIARARSLVPALMAALRRHGSDPEPSGGKISPADWVLHWRELTGESRVEAEIALSRLLSSGVAPDREMKLASLPGLTAEIRDRLTPTHRHSKGGVYRVIGRALLEQDLSDVILYLDMEEGILWVRRADQFLDGRFTPLVEEWEPPAPMVLRGRK